MGEGGNGEMGEGVFANIFDLFHRPFTKLKGKDTFIHGGMSFYLPQSVLNSFLWC